MKKKSRVYNLNEAHPELSGFYGSLVRCRHNGILLTPGALCVADEFSAWWLLDMIAALQCEAAIATMAPQVWRLECHAPDVDMATLTCRNAKIVWSQQMMTDFPYPGVELWVENRTLYLPTER
jgi:hypothetical protein